MAIPLNLDIHIRQTGAEVFGLVQQGIMSVGGAAATKTAAGLQNVAASLQSVIEYAGKVPAQLLFATGAIETLSQQARVTPMSLDIMADRLDMLRLSLIRARFPTLDLEQAVLRLDKADWLMQNTLKGSSEALRTQATALQTVSRSTVEAAGGTERVTVATDSATRATRNYRDAAMQAITPMNVMSSVTQGLMMGMGALQGSLMSVGFGLIFLRWSIPPVTLGVAALVIALGGVISALKSVSEDYLPLAADSVKRIGDAFSFIKDTFVGPVWGEILIPLIDIMAGYAEKVRDMATSVRYSAEMQERWHGVIMTFIDLLQANKHLFAEHEDEIRRGIALAYEAAFTSLEILMNSMRVFLDLLPSLILGWEDFGRTVGIAVGPLRDLLNVMQEIGAIGDITLGDTLKYFLENIGPTILGALIGSIVPGIGTAVGALIGTIVGEFLKGLNDLLGGGVTTWFKENFSGTFWGAAIGATIGSVVPAVGTAIGAIAGAIIGGIVSSLVSGKEEIIYFFKVSMPDWFREGLEWLQEKVTKLGEIPIIALAAGLCESFIVALGKVGDAIWKFFKEELLSRILDGLRGLKKDIEDWINRNLKHSIEVGAIPVHMSLVPAWTKGTVPQFDWAPIAKAASYSLNRAPGGMFSAATAAPTVTVNVSGNLFLDQETADKLSTIVEKRITGRLSSLYGRSLA